jgi:hypothetical protein
MGEVLFPRVVQKVTNPLYVAPVFADNTWEGIIKACQTNRVPDSWTVGAQKTMTINGTDYAIDIIGKNHDDYADGSGKAPLTFQLHDLYDTEYAMNGNGGNNTGWDGCDMRLKHLPAMLSLMPAEVQAGIHEVTKKTSAGAQSTKIEESADKLFLLSEIEVFGEVQLSMHGEGDQYAYYLNGNSKKKYPLDSTDAEYWWGRSPNSSNGVWYCCVNSFGSTARTAPDDNEAIAPAFCF